MRHLRRLSPAQADRLREAPFTYDEVGGTRTTYPSGYPAGYRLVRNFRVIGAGREDFDVASRKLMTWQMQRAAGLRVTSSSAHVEADAVVLLRLGVGPFALKIPCRVVYVVDEPDRQGFGYGTLPGHPESGEEAFVVDIGGDDRVTFTATAFSRPGGLLAKLGGPVTRWMQDRALRRYAAGLRSG